MPSHPSNADDQLREQLVAYLDGELPPEEAHALEARLGTDKTYQQELQSLDRTWNALDALPHVTAGEDFSQTTIEMVAVEAKQHVAELTAALPVQRRRRHWRTAGVVAAALLVGFLLARGFTNSQDRQLAHHLPTIWQVDALVQTPSAEFLQRLREKQPDLIEEYATAEIQQQATAWTAIAGESSWRRISRIKELPRADKSRLLSSERRFRAMTPNRQDALREVQEEISLVEQKSSGLYKTTLAYHQWVLEQTPGTQIELRQLETDNQRLDLIARLRQEEIVMARRVLTTKDAEALRKAVRQLGDRPEVLRLPDDLEQLFKEIRHSIDRAPTRRMVEQANKRFNNAMKRHAALRIALLARFAYAPQRGSLWSRVVAGPQGSRLRDQARKDWKSIEPELLGALGAKPQRALEGEPDWRRAAVLGQWVLQGAADAFDPSSMETFFASSALDDHERNELLALPREEMNEQLRRYYFERELGGLDPRSLGELAPLLGGPEGRGAFDPNRGGPRLDRPSRGNGRGGGGRNGSDRNGPDRNGPSGRRGERPGGL